MKTGFPPRKEFELALKRTLLGIYKSGNQDVEGAARDRNFTPGATYIGQNESHWKLNVSLKFCCAGGTGPNRIMIMVASIHTTVTRKISTHRQSILSKELLV